MPIFKIRSTDVESTVVRYLKSTDGNEATNCVTEKDCVTEDGGQFRQEYKFKEEYDLSKSDDSFIAGHNIDGRVVFPPAGFLFLIWRAIAKAFNKTLEETVVVLENISFSKTVSEPNKNRFGFEVNIQRKTDEFEISCENGIAVTGSFKVMADRASNKFLLDSTQCQTIEEKELNLTADDVYEELNHRGYYYKGIFKGIISSDLLFRNGLVHWENNWISFIDTLLQFNNIASTARGLYLPSKMKRVFIDPMTQYQHILSKTVLIQNNKNINVIRAGGVEIQGLEWTLHTFCDNSHQMPIIKKIVFIPSNNPQDNEKDLSGKIMKNGEWGCYKYQTIQDSANYQEVENAFVTASTCKSESLTSFRWVEGTSRHTDSSEKELCYVYITALNKCDLMRATRKWLPSKLEEGLYKNECTLGIEFSGRTSKGKRVMGIVSSRALATTVLADKNFLWEIPDNWSLEKAATVPVAYVTAYYALIVRGRMTCRDSVLIHRGASHIGQAAINLALQAGCEVFTTVDSSHDHAFLLARFYDLKETNIGSALDTSFEQMILQNTNGRGVDIVLNYFEANTITSSIRCLTNSGRFLNLGNMNSDKTSTVISMSANKTFHSIQMDALTDTEKQIVAQLMREGIAYGVVHALTPTTFSSQQMQRAFMYMASSLNITKVLIEIKSEEPEGGKKEINKISALRRTYMHPQKCYVIIGDQSSFSLEIAQWLTERGALKLALYFNNDGLSARQSWYTRRWREKGATVVAKTNAVTNKEAQNILNEAAALGPIGGIFIISTKTQQKFLRDIKVEDLDKTEKSRLKVVKYLDEVSRALAPDLDFFVEFSSFYTGSGCSDNINSGIAPCAVTRLMEKRIEDRLPGLAIQWESIDKFVIEEEKLQTNESSVGITPQSVKFFIESLDTILPQNHGVVASYLVANQ